MKRQTIIIKCLFSIGLVLAIAAAAGAFTYKGYKWPSRPTITVDEDGISSVNDGDSGVAKTRSAITSYNAWNGAGAGSLVATTEGSVSSWATCDGSPMLRFSDPDDTCTGSCLAVAITCYSGSTILDGDINTNISDHKWTSKGEDPDEFWDCVWDFQGEYYVEAIMVHEVGHVLGLKHTDVSGATMYPTVGSCDNSNATTAEDDENGILSLYGKKKYKFTNGTMNLYTEHPGNTTYKAYARVYLGSSVNLIGARLTGKGHNNDSVGYARVMRVEVNGNTYKVISWLNDGETKSFDFTVPNGVLQRGWNDIRAYIHWSTPEYDDGHWISLNIVN